jgi:hypothetical protein
MVTMANFFAENWQKLQKIVIITSTPDNQNHSKYGLLWYLKKELAKVNYAPNLVTLSRTY